MKFVLRTETTITLIMKECHQRSGAKLSQHCGNNPLSELSMIGTRSVRVCFDYLASALS